MAKDKSTEEHGKLALAKYLSDRQPPCPTDYERTIVSDAFHAGWNMAVVYCLDVFEDCARDKFKGIN